MSYNYNLVNAFVDLSEAKIDSRKIRNRRIKKLQEAKFDVNNPTDLEKARELKNRHLEEEPELEVIDANADNIDHILKNQEYVGQAMITCNICKAHRFTKLEDLKQNADGTYVLSDDSKNECPNCHSTTVTYTLAGQVAAVNKPAKVSEPEPAFTNDAEPLSDVLAFDNEPEPEEPKAEPEVEEKPEEVDVTADDFDLNFDDDDDKTPYDEVSDKDMEKEIYPWDEEDEDDKNESLNESFSEETFNDYVPSEIDVAYDDLDAAVEFEGVEYTNTSGPMNDYGDTGERAWTSRGIVNNWTLSVEITREDVERFIKSQMHKEPTDSAIYEIFVEGTKNGWYDEFASWLAEEYRDKAIENAQKNAEMSDVDEWLDSDSFEESVEQDEYELLDDSEKDDGKDVWERAEDPEYEYDELFESICKANNLDPKAVFRKTRNEYWIKEALDTKNPELLQTVYENYVDGNIELMKMFKESTGYRTELESILEANNIQVVKELDETAPKNDDPVKAKAAAMEIANAKDLRGVIYGYNKGDKFYALEPRECLTQEDLLQARREIIHQYHASSISVAYPDKNAYESFKDRKTLGEAIKVCKEHNIPFIVRKSIREGYRYDLLKESVTVNTTSASHIEVNDKCVTVDSDDKHTEVTTTGPVSITHNDDGSVAVCEDPTPIAEPEAVEPVGVPTPADMGISGPDDSISDKTVAEEPIADSDIIKPVDDLDVADVTPNAEGEEPVDVDIHEAKGSYVEEPIKEESVITEASDEEPIDVEIESETDEGEDDSVNVPATKETDSTEVGLNLSPEDEKIVKKLLDVASWTYQAILDNYGIEVDPRLVLRDMIQDLQLIGGAVKPDSLPDTPLNQLTKSMYEMFDGFYSMYGIDHEAQLKRAIAMLDGPSFTKEGIEKSVASDRFLSAARAGAIDYIPDNIQRIGVRDESVDTDDSLKPDENKEIITEDKTPKYDQLSYDDLPIEEQEFLTESEIRLKAEDFDVDEALSFCEVCGKPVKECTCKDCTDDINEELSDEELNSIFTLKQE